MKKQNVLQTETLASSEMKEKYVAPMAVAYSLHNEGVLCSSATTGTMDDPFYGDSAGFSGVEKTSVWD